MNKQSQTKSLFPKWPKHIPRWFRQIFTNKLSATKIDYFSAAEKEYKKLDFTDRKMLESILIDYYEMGIIKIIGNMIIAQPEPTPNNIIFLSTGFRDY